MRLNRKSITILLACFFVLVLAGGLFYYFKYYKTGADTLTKRNTSCVIKVVDKDTGKPVANASVSFNIMPSGAISSSNTKGCVPLPSEIAATRAGDFYNITIIGNNFKPIIRYITITNNLLSGTEQTIIKVSPSTSKVSKEKINSQISANNSSNSTNGLIETAKAAGSRKETIFYVYDSSSPIPSGANHGAPIKGVVLKFIDQKLVVASCITDENGYCKVSFLKDYWMIDVSLTKKGYKTELEFVSLQAMDNNKQVYLDPVYLSMWPDYKEKNIGPITGQSLNNAECNKSYQFNVVFVALEEDINKPLWNQKSIQKITNYLATAMCGLSQSDPSLNPLPVPKIYLRNTTFSIENRGYASVGEAAIVAINSDFCGGMSGSTLTNCENEKEYWNFYMPVHEYGHILDLFNSSGKTELTAGRYSGNAVFLNLFSLINSHGSSDNAGTSIWGPENDKFTQPLWQPQCAEISASDSRKCYYTTNPLEFWAVSFAYWMASSLIKNLPPNYFVQIKATGLFNTDNFVLADPKALNTFNFWKKFMSTSLGTYCHPTLMDENGVKQGLSTYPIVEPKPSFTKGGPLASGVVYTPDQILAGTPVVGSSLTINYKKLPANYVATTMTDENFSVVPYSTGINQLNLLAKFPATKGAWPDTLTSDAKRCGIYERGMLAQSDKTADIKAADVKKGPYGLYSVKDYELKGYFRCNKTEPYKVVTIKSKTNLNTSTKDVILNIDLTKYITCPKALDPGPPPEFPTRPSDKPPDV